MRKILLLSILMISFAFAIQNSFAQDTAAKTNYYSFGGHAFTDDHFPITFGYAELYSVEDFEVIIETVRIDTLGYYYFYRIPEGKYFVKAGVTVGDPNYGRYSSTYYPSTPLWEDAEIIDLDSTSWEYDIALFNMDPEIHTNGSGKISGIIQINEKPFAENVDVMLCNIDLEPLMHWPTNSLGEFSFENLSYGTYVLYPQVTGLTTHPISIQISESQSQYTGIEITIKDGQIASYINEDLISGNSFMLYPNPSSILLNIRFETYEVAQLSTRIFDLSGRLVYEVSSTTNIGMNIQEINTGDWQNGYYFCDILIDGQSAIRQKIAVVH